MERDVTSEQNPGSDQFSYHTRFRPSMHPEAIKRAVLWVSPQMLTGAGARPTNGRPGSGQPYVRLASVTVEVGRAEMRDGDCIDRGYV